MTGKAEKAWRWNNPWRILGWAAAVALLLTPLVAMQFTDEVKWDGPDFIFMGALFGSIGLGFELAVRKSGNWAYRLGAGIALVSAFLLVWINAAVGIIGDDNPLNLLYGGVIAVGLAGAIGAGFRAEGMARAMLAAAVAQALVAVVVFVAAPHEPPGQIPILLLNGFFVMLLAIAAALFRKAARGQ